VPLTERWSVSFSRQASDGNYGSETIRIERVLVALDGESMHQDDAIEALKECRQLVHQELSRSPNWSVRRAIEEPKTTATVGGDDDDDDPEDLPY